MLDKSIDGALLALRTQILRGDMDGLDHVEALLELRGVAMPRVLPAKRLDAARKRHRQVQITNLLRGDGLTLAQLCEALKAAQPDKCSVRIYNQTATALWKYKKRGLVKNCDGVWKLAP